MAHETENGDLAWNAAREDALSALDQALQWELPESSWTEVALALRQMARAAADEDEESLSSATAYLELCSPKRTTVKLGGPITGPASKQIRELGTEVNARLESPRNAGSAVRSGTGAGTKKK
jgi:hypothetical protein